jgi:hypothetical protein
MINILNDIYKYFFYDPLLNSFKLHHNDHNKYYYEIDVEKFTEILNFNFTLNCSPIIPLGTLEIYQKEEDACSNNINNTKTIPFTVPEFVNNEDGLDQIHLRYNHCLPHQNTVAIIEIESKDYTDLTVCVGQNWIIKDEL